MRGDRSPRPTADIQNFAAGCRDNQKAVDPPTIAEAITPRFGESGGVPPVEPDHFVSRSRPRHGFTGPFGFASSSGRACRCLSVTPQ